jgi:hypothetical protein
LSVLTADVYRNRLDLELTRAPITDLRPGEVLWQSTWHRPRAAPLVGTFAPDGRLSIDGDRKVLERTGRFLPYDGG